MPPPAPRKKMSGLTIALIAVGSMLALCVAGVVGAVIATGAKAPTSTSSQQGQPISTTAPAPPAPEKPSYYVPQASDFKLTPKVLEKKCYGSAGCLISFRIEVSYTGTSQPDPAKTYEVTYEVKGGKEPLTNTLRITGTRAMVEDRETIQTASSKDELTVVTVSVSER